MQGFGTIEKQYQNLDLAYNELETEFMAVNKEIRTQQDFGMYLPVKYIKFLFKIYFYSTMKSPILDFIGRFSQKNHSFGKINL